MTTAHRPTFKPSTGNNEQGGALVIVPTRIYAAKDMPGYLTLKQRQQGQFNYEDISKKDFKKELLEKEKLLLQKKSCISSELMEKLQYSDDDQDKEEVEKQIKKKIKTSDNNNQPNMLKNKIVDNYQPQNLFPDDEDDANFANSSSDEEIVNKQSKQKQQKKKKQEEDEDQSDSSSDSSDNKESGDDSDEDSDNELLMKEFLRLKKQKEEEELQKAKLKGEDQEQFENKTKEILRGNPLLEESGSYSLNKRWYEDTVFKNQARIEKKNSKKKFINDNVRNEFHYKFLAKYILT